MEDWGWRTMWVLSPRQLLMVSHSLTTDLLPLLSASIFTSEKILFDVWWSSIKYRSQGSGKNQLTLHQRQGQSGSQSRSWDLLEKLALYALPRHYVAESIYVYLPFLLSLIVALFSFGFCIIHWDSFPTILTFHSFYFKAQRKTRLWLD